MSHHYLTSALQQFHYYKSLGDKTFTQLDDEKLCWQYNEESNSIANIIKHLCGNMLSRWTNFLTEDGEKSWRNRDVEFEIFNTSKEALIEIWEKGWTCLFDALASLTEEDLNRTVLIRNEAHTVIEAINRQLAHYPYHIGQIVFIGKMCSNQAWNSLSIPKGNSVAFNQEKFGESRK